MSFASVPSPGSVSSPTTIPCNQGEFIPWPSESPTPQVSPSTFETHEISYEERASASPSSGNKGPNLACPRAIVAASSQAMTSFATPSLTLDNPATSSYSLTWELEQGIVDDAGEPELPDEGFYYSVEQEKEEEERRRLLWSSPGARKILKSLGRVPPPSPPPETCSTRLRGTKANKVAAQHTMERRINPKF